MSTGVRKTYCAFCSKQEGALVACTADGICQTCRSYAHPGYWGRSLSNIEWEAREAVLAASRRMEGERRRMEHAQRLLDAVGVQKAQNAKDGYVEPGKCPNGKRP